MGLGISFSVVVGDVPNIILPTFCVESFFVTALINLLSLGPPRFPANTLTKLWKNFFVMRKKSKLTCQPVVRIRFYMQVWNRLLCGCNRVHKSNIAGVVSGNIKAYQ